MNVSIEGRAGAVVERRFIVSGRGIRPHEDVIHALRHRYARFGFESIKCVFGFPRENSRLYGGRGGPGRRRFLCDDHIETLRHNGITFDLVLSNHFFSEGAYEETRPILEKHHLEGNGVVCHNDCLASRIRKEFPLYTLRASMIKGLKTSEEIERALDLYDYVTLPMKLCDDPATLESIVSKHRVILFGNAFCAYFCPTNPCYLDISKAHFDPAYSRTREVCTQAHRTCDYLEFDLDDAIYEDFSFFKLIPPKLKRLGVSPRAKATAQNAPGR